MARKSTEKNKQEQARTNVTTGILTYKVGSTCLKYNFAFTEVDLEALRAYVEENATKTVPMTEVELTQEAYQMQLFLDRAGFYRQNQVQLRNYCSTNKRLYTDAWHYWFSKVTHGRHTSN